MDPISFLVACLAVYGILKRAPALIGEAIAEATAASRGEESQAAKDRRQRLVNAGIDPATGGAARQFFGNWWRDFWLDLDGKRRNPIPTQNSAQGGRWQRWWDEARRRTGDRLNQWRPGSTDGQSVTLDNPEATKPSKGGTPPPGPPGPAPASGPEPAAPPPSPPPGAAKPQPDPASQEPPRRTAGPSAPPRSSHSTRDPDTRAPIRVEATLGEPVRSPAATGTAILEGEPMSSAVAVPVTGVVSGAAEARAIQLALTAATTAYLTELARIRSRIHSVGEQALGVVQFAGRSTVVNAIAEAAGAAAAAEAHARATDSEVQPLLHQVAREFDRRNS